MNSWIYVLSVVTFFLLYAVMYAAIKKRKPFKRAFFVMLFGVATMICVNIASEFTGVYLPVSPLSLTVSSCLGLPGVAVMMVVSWVL